MDKGDTHRWAQDPPPSPLAILESCLYVDDLARAESFYADILGLEFVTRQEGRHLFFRVGSGMLLLFVPQVSADESSDLPPHGAIGAGHLAFQVPQESLPRWEKRLWQCGTGVEHVVEWPNSARSIYFRDPAGNSLEFSSAALWGL